MADRIWVIRGYDGLEEVFKRTLPVGYLPDKEMIVLLKRLASRHLDDYEVVSSSLRKSSKGYAPYLEVHSSRETSGTGYHYTAVVRDAD